MDKVKLGIIGIGNMGSAHFRSVLEGQTPEIDLVAVADRNASRLEWAKESLPGTVAVFEEGDALIDSGLCDAVLIATPHYQHPPLAMRAFAQGLHVLSEKPAGVYTVQVREMNEAADRSGVVFALMYNQRTNCLYRKMHEMVQSSELGELQRVSWIITDWFRTQYYYDSGAWRARPGPARAAARCSTSALTTWICCSGSAACPRA